MNISSALTQYATARDTTRPSLSPNVGQDALYFDYLATRVRALV